MVATIITSVKHMITKSQETLGIAVRGLHSKLAKMSNADAYYMYEKYAEEHDIRALMQHPINHKKPFLEWAFNTPYNQIADPNPVDLLIERYKQAKRQSFQHKNAKENISELALAYKLVIQDLASPEEWQRFKLLNKEV